MKPVARRTRFKVASHLARWLAALTLLVAGGSAHALCTLVCSCTVSTTSVAFSAYNPLASSNVDSTGVATVSCGGVAGLFIGYTIALSAGSSGNLAARSLASGANQLAYNLYTTSGLTTVWGDGSGSTATVAGSITLDVLGSSQAKSYTIYGRVPSGQQTAAPGSYNDTIVVTVTYN